MPSHEAEPSNVNILAGDIGGTNVRLALYEATGERLDLLAEKSFASRDHPGFPEIVARFLEGMARSVDRAAVGVAGPVVDGRCQVTNLPWIVDARALAQRFGWGGVWLLNDLEALAHGLAALAPGEFATLAPGAAGARGNRALIAAGTGLGQAGLYWDGERHWPFATEGGHAGFAPESELESELLGFLRPRLGRVGWENVLSGPGLANLFEFFLARSGAPEPAWYREATAAGDPPAAISAAAEAGQSFEANQALDLFVRLYGSEAGNLALKLNARGGLYLGGGIAPRLLDRLRSGAFLEAMRTKAPMRELLEAIPVRVVLHKSAALLGAARFATERERRG